MMELSSVPNFRPLPRRCESYGPVYRSGSWSAISEEDCAKAFMGGLRPLIDLRSAVEKARHPIPDHVVRSGIEVLHCELASYSAASIMAPIPTCADYVDYYINMVESCRSGFCQAIECIDKSAGVSRAYFCHAGKDRTGVVSAVLLSRWRFDDREIARDYALSGEYLARHLDWFRRNWERRGISRDAYAARLGSKAEIMTSFLERIRDRYGELSDFILNADARAEGT